MVTDIRSVLSPQYYSSSLPGYRVNTSFHTLPVTPGGWEVGGGKGVVSSLRSHFSFSQGRLGSGNEVTTPGKLSVRVVASEANPSALPSP